jgi:transcriptional regulator with XRE-family HTH domain
MSTWRDRLSEAIARSGLTEAEIQRRAGVNRTWFRDVLRKKQTPSVDNLAKVAKVLGLTLAKLYENIDHAPVTIAVTRRATGDTWADVPPEDARLVSLPVLTHDYVAVELIGSPPPGYRRGDTLCGVRAEAASNYIGRECLLETADGRKLIRVLLKGSRQGLFTLRSLEPTVADELDIELVWAAPITIILR